MFTTLEELKNLKEIIVCLLNSISPPQITLNDLCNRFRQKTGKEIRRWFKHNSKTVPKLVSLFENYLADIAELDMKSKAPEVLVIGKGDGYKKINFHENVEKLSKVQCEKNLKTSLQSMKGASKETAIAVEEETTDYFEFDYVEPPIRLTQEFWALGSEVEQFKSYRDFQMVHIAYVKLRLVFLYNQVGRSKLHIHTLAALFRQLYNESFFQQTILKHYITSVNDRDKDVITFLKRFCGDFLYVTDEGKTNVCKSMSMLLTKFMQDVVKALARLHELGGPGLPVELPTLPDHLHFMGSVTANNIPVDVRRATEYTHFAGGPSNPSVPNFLDFPRRAEDPDQTSTELPPTQDKSTDVTSTQEQETQETPMELSPTPDLPIQLPPNDMPPIRLPPNQLPLNLLPPNQIPYNPLLQFPPNQLPPGAFPPNRFPSNISPNQMPQNVPPNQMQPNQLPPNHIPRGRFPPPPKFFPPKQVPMRQSRPSIHDVNDAVNTIRSRICREHKAVKIPEIIHEVCMQFGVTSLKDLRPTGYREIRRESDIPALNDIIKLKGKVSAFSQAFGTFRNVCTLHELEEELCKMESKQVFDDLRLGPLQKQLIVWDLFQFPPDREVIPPITTFDVFRLLWKCYDEKYTKERKSAKQSDGSYATARDMHVKILLPDFMEYCRQNYGFSQIEECGLRINNVGYALQACRKAWFSDSHNMKKVLSKFKEQLNTDFAQQLEHTKNMVMGPLLNPDESDNEILRNQFMKIPLLDSFRQIYKILQQLKREACKTLPTTAYLVNFSDITMNALSVIQKDELMSTIFHILLSIAPFKTLKKSDVQILKYLGFHKAVEEVTEGVPEEKKVSRIVCQDSETKEEKIITIPRSIVTSTVNKWFSKTTTFNLKVLANLEEQITGEVQEGLTSFDRLGHGSFLKFITENKSIKRLLDFGTATSSDVLGTKVSKEELIHFVIQCGTSGKKADIVRAMEMQFRMPCDGKNAEQILKVADENRKRRECLISYQHCFITGSDYHKDVKEIGNKKSFTQLAVKRIKTAPYLVELSQWINWDILFAAKLGSMKDFLNKNFKLKDSAFTFLELDIGRYVKILKYCSIDDFKKAVNSLDAAKSSACIVNILMASLNINSAPLSMLSNLIQNSFMHNIGRSLRPNSESGKKLIGFVLESFRLIPFEMLCCIAQKLFINRLAGAFGTQKVSTMLLQASFDKLEYRRVLHGLGHHLSVNEWIKDAEHYIAVNIGPDINEEDFVIPKPDPDVDKKDKKKKKTKPELESGEILSDGEIQSDEDGEMKTGGDGSEEESDNEMEIVQPSSMETQAKPATATSAAIEIAVKQEPIEIEAGQQTIVERKSVDGQQQTAYNIDRCKEFVAMIRHDEFGVGMKFGEKEKKILDIHRAREGRSLHRLSKELYTKDSHFVLELIQNADDNEYPSEFISQGSEEKPTVVFIVETERVTVLNNEKGFMDANIRALCDIGKSTKGIHRKGYIGQKGIGFKSVFRVTDKPEVHSNSFHLKFDASSGPNGYILPEWVDEGHDMMYTVPMCSARDSVPWMTKIVLPLRTEMQHAKLTSRFHDIHPSLLLFLNRLQMVVIDDKVSGTVKVMKKEVIDKNLVKLTENDDSTLWFVVTKEIPIELGEEVKHSDISIAFPLFGDDKEKQETAQPIFAYLPLRSYGFKFIIQADFEVPSSREDIDMDSAWNQCILHYIPELVTEAFEQFKAHPHFNGLEGAIEYFKFMDMEDHVLGIFRQVAHNTIKCLQREPCMPYENEKGRVTWALPSATVIGSDEERKTIPPQMLLKNLGLNFVAKDVQVNVKESILDSLGVSKMSVEQLQDIAKVYLKELEDKRDSDGNLTVSLEWIGEWLSVLFSTLQDNCDFSDETISLIRSLKIFVLCDGSNVSLNEDTVFFPIDNEGSKRKGNDPLEIIEKDLKILSHKIYENLDQIKKQQVRRLLKDLGVKSMTPSDLIYNHVIPLFKEERWQTKSEKLLVACVSYLRHQLSIDSEIYDISDLKNDIVLVTNKGLKQPSNWRVYIPAEYGNDVNLMKRFPACDWTVVSSVYFTKQSSSMEKKAWRDFFVSLGLHKFMGMHTTTLELHTSDLPTSAWKEACKAWPATQDGLYIIEDTGIPEFDSLLQSKDKKQISQFAELINQHWADTFQKHEVQKENVDVKDSTGKKIATTHCSFYLKLRNSKWIPSSNEREIRLFVPNQLYIVTASVERLFGKKVDYVHPKISNEDFKEVLGIQREVKMVNFLTEFKRWNESAEVFTTTYGHIQNIYRYIRDIVLEEAKEMMVERCIFLMTYTSLSKNPSKLVDSDIIDGRFYRIKEVCWEDPSDVVEISKDIYGTRRVLKGFYPDHMREFFVQTLEVPLFPTTTEYLNAVYNLVNRTILPDNDALKKLYKMIYVLGQKSVVKEKLEEFRDWGLPETTEEMLEMYRSMEEYVDPEMRETLHSAKNINTRLIPTFSNIFLSISKKPILCIDTQLLQIYSKERQVDIAVLQEIARSYRDHKRPSHLRRSKEREIETVTLFVMLFYKACNLELLSDIQTKPEVVAMVVSDGSHFWEEVLHNIVPAIQRFMRVYLPDVYYDLQKKDFAEYLRTVEIHTCKRLEIVYRLKNRESIDIRQTKVALVQKMEKYNRTVVHIMEQFSEGFQQGEAIMREMMGIFVGDNAENKELVTEFVLTYTTVLNKEAFMRRKRLSFLPPNEVMWDFPAPPELYPTVVEEEEQKKPENSVNEQVADADNVVKEQKEARKEPVAKRTRVTGEDTDLRNAADGSELSARSTKSGVTDSLVDDNSIVDMEVTSEGECGVQNQEISSTQNGVTIINEERSRGKKRKLDDGELEEEEEGEISSEKTKKGGDRKEGESGKTANEWFRDYSAAARFNNLKASRKYLEMQSVDLEEQYEDVSLGTEKKIESSKVDLERLLEANKDPGSEVGQIGEEIVYKHLCRQYEAEVKNQIVEIEWINENEEFGLPYDMKLTFFDQRNPPIVYIEVKTTYLNEKKEFEISSNQVKFALEQEDRFHLYRLSGVRSPREMKLRRLANLSTYLDNKSVRLFMVL